MPTKQVSAFQDSFAGGAFRDVASYLIPPNGLRDLVDSYTEEDGGAVERGGTVYLTDAAFDTSLRWVWAGYFDAGERIVFASDENFGVVDADGESPINLGGSGMVHPAPSAYIPDTGGAGMLFIGGGTIYAGSRKAANYGAGTVTTTNGSATVTGSGTAWLANVDAGMLFVTGAERLYVVKAVVSDTEITLSEPYEGTTGAGKNYTLAALATIGTIYPDAAAYGVCANRLIWFEGNLVHASEPLRPHDLTATIGASEIPTTHELPEGVRVTGTGTTGLTLDVFTTHGLWTLEGLTFDITDPSGNPQHRLNRLSGEIILWDANGIASWENTLVAPCVDGVYLIDGISDPSRISHPLDEEVMDYVERGYRTGQAAVHRGRYLLPVYSGAVTMQDQLICRINRPIKVGGQTVHPWSRFARHAKTMIAYTLRVGEATREPSLIGASSDARLSECPYFDAPLTSADANGEEHLLDLTSRAFRIAESSRNAYRNVRIKTEEAGAPDPVLEVSWSDGGVEAGGAQFDLAEFDNDVFAFSGASFTEASCTVRDEPGGTRYYRCAINKSRREMSIRLRAKEPTTSLTIRSLDLRARPGPVRR